MNYILHYCSHCTRRQNSKKKYIKRVENEKFEKLVYIKRNMLCCILHKYKEDDYSKDIVCNV